MTREEAIEELKEYEDGLDLEYATPFDKAILYAIKALEQEPVIDKIRAEIDKIYEREGNSVDCLNALNELKWFIDKYKAEEVQAFFKEVEDGECK